MRGAYCVGVQKPITHLLKLDVACEKAIVDVTKHLTEVEGRLDILINNVSSFKNVAHSSR